jgi:hypothetical protein
MRVQFPASKHTELPALAMMKEKTKDEWSVAEWVAFMKGKTELR